MKKSRFRSIVIGTLIGCAFGLVSHQLVAIFLVSGPYSHFLIPPRELWPRMLYTTLILGVWLGASIGFLGGLFVPFNLHSALFTRLIGMASCTFCTLLTWSSYSDIVSRTNPVKNCSSAFVTALSFFLIFRVSKEIGLMIESLRYKK